LRGELDWIVMKALEKDRHRRYQSAADFASDIECYLKDEPVQACPPSTRYRLGKFARKHRVMLASAAGLLVLLLAGIVGLTLANRKVTAALDAEIEAQTETYAGLDTADGVIQALIRSRVKVRDTEKSILRNALKLNAKFFDDPGMTPKARARTADMHLRVANIHVFLDEPQKAEIAYGKAVELYQKLASDFPAAEVYRDQLAKSNFNLGFLLNDQNNRAEAEAAFRRCVALHENLAADSPTMPRYQGDLADDLNNLGVVLSEQSKFAHAAGVYGQAIRLGEKLTAAYPDFANYQINLAGSYSNLGNVVRDQGNPAEALNWYGKAITSLTAVRAANRQFEDARLYLRNAHWDRANALGRLARHGEAINDWQRAIGLDEGRDRDSLLLFLEAAKTEEQLKKQVKASNAAAASGLLYDAARVLAQAAGAAGISNEPALQKHYASRALALLREAKAAGLFHDGKRIEELKKDQALLALRQDSGYQKFVAELVAGMKQ